MKVIPKIAPTLTLCVLGCLALVGCHDSRPIEKAGPLRFEFSVGIDDGQKGQYLTAVVGQLENSGLVAIRDAATEHAVNQNRSTQVYLLYGVSPRSKEDLLVTFVTNSGDPDEFLVQIYEGGIPSEDVIALNQDLLEIADRFRKK